ncbi:ABC transporter ATP-binding protein [Pseudonocardiaceae bacterium YIM PH 21723]|nr:ABC transporter ATP-binding protein [Pseudonocardiaceae bacterium YIM PH 21723]
MSLLDVSELTVSFGPDEAVRGIGFTIGPGEVLGLVGESGSGKSVTAQAMLGLLPARSRCTGSVRFRDRELLGLPERELARLRGDRISMIFQDPTSALTPVLRIGDQVAEAVRIHRPRLGARAAEQRAVELLELVGIPDAARRANAFPHEFSGGMRQRVLIAMAIANDPDLIIADEPTTALDVTVQAQVLEVLRTAREVTGAAILLITHDLGVVAGMADRVAVMREGQIAENASVTDLFDAPSSPYTAELLAAVPRVDDPLKIRGELPQAPDVLRVHGLTRHYPLTTGALWRRRTGTVHAVDGVDLTVRAGETLALVGESGCGKSSTLTDILELRAPMGGSIEVLGQDVSTLDSRRRRALRRDLQVVFQDPYGSLDPRMTVGEILAEPLRVHGFGRAHIGRRVPELLDLVGLRGDHAQRFPAEFSGGQRQRVAIARALACEPKLLLLDEPVSALDVSVRAGVLNLLRELQIRLGLSTVFVAHDLAVVRNIADRVAVMHLGRIVECGPVAEVFAHPAHPYTRALLSAVPIPDPVRERARTRIVLAGDPPSPATPPTGCRFRTRCFVFEVLDDEQRGACIRTDPDRRSPDGMIDHDVACHHAETGYLSGGSRR